MPLKQLTHSQTGDSIQNGNKTFALKRSTFNRNPVNSVFRLGTIDGRTLAGFDDVVDAERGLIAAAELAVL